MTRVKQKVLKAKEPKKIEEVKMAKKRNHRITLFLQILRWLLLALGILFFLWLAKNLGWLKI